MGKAHIFRRQGSNARPARKQRRQIQQPVFTPPARRIRPAKAYTFQTASRPEASNIPNEKAEYPMTQQIKYKRVLLKLSGESLMGSDPFGINHDTIVQTVGEIAEVVKMGVQVGIVVGGGNIFRGVSAQAGSMDRATADYMGMMATVMNTLALKDAFETLGIKARVQSALSMQQIAETYARPKAIQYLEEGKVVIFAAGTGNPFFTTDTAAALRGAEMNCDVMLKATNVDGVYTADPKKDPSATRYETITFDEALLKNLKVMDATAFALCRERKLNIVVFGIAKEGSLKRVVTGENEGTLVHC